MKRKGNLYNEICSIENLWLADEIARKGKKNQKSVIEHDMNRSGNLVELNRALICREYKTSRYTVFKIRDKKERTIYRLPYYPDRIVHHAIMNKLEPIFISTFTADTYSCIKGRGISGAYNNLKQALKDTNNTVYCLKIDIRKFYPSINHEILKQLIRRKIKDADLLWLLDEIIDSADGLPIGNYLSQYLANYYLSYFDHWIKEQLCVRYYFRYCDDIVVLGADKDYLHGILRKMKEYLFDRLRLTVKDNYQVFPVKDRGIDFVGYVFYHTHILLRKSIKKAFARMLKYNRNDKSIAAYKGWTNACNSYNLLNKLGMKNFSELKINNRGNYVQPQIFVGDKISINKILNRQIVVHDYDIRDSKYEGKGKCLFLQISINDSKRVVFTSAKKLIEDIVEIADEDFPFITTITEIDGSSMLQFS